MIRLSVLLLCFSAFLSAETPCSIEIESVKQTAEHYTIVLKHRAECEILMEHNVSTVSLVSKPYEKVNQYRDSNGSETVKMTEKIIALAKSKMGNSYEPAKAGPDYFDCSGFVYYVFRKNSINIPRSSLSQSQSGEKVPREKLKRGDMVFFDTHERGHVNHSGIYLGDGKFIHSSSGKAYGVTVSDIDKGFYKDKFRWGVRKLP